MIEIASPHKRIQSVIQIGGSKSISNRLLMIKELLCPDLKLLNLSDSEDTLLLTEALKQIKHKNSGTINVKHAGTDMRFLTAFLSITNGEWLLTGSERMKERPIVELVRALKVLGAEIAFTENEKYPPLLIKGKQLKGGELEIDGSISSQFISAILLISPTFENGLNLKLKGTIVSRPYITMTITLLKSLGVQITEFNYSIQVSPFIGKAKQQSFSIESDWSSASYYYSICALSENTEIELKHFDQQSLQADSVLPNIYKKLGVQTEFKNGTLILSSIPSESKEFNYDCSHCPDIAQTIAVTCVGLGINCHLTGLKTLKIKESDRILALKTELQKFGAKVEIGLESISIVPEKQEARNKKQETRNIEPETIETYKDHRMAMSFAPLCLIYKTLKIKDPSVVNKSYPGFWEDLKSLGFNVNLLP